MCRTINHRMVICKFPLVITKTSQKQLVNFKNFEQNWSMKYQLAAIAFEEYDLNIAQIKENFLN